MTASAIFMSSESGQHIPAEMIHYGMTKTAQVAVARGLAESVAGTGVTVNSVLAGPTASEGAGNFVASMAKQQNISEAEVEKQFFEMIRPTSLLKRFESTEEVASVVVFVASTQAVAINGAAVRAEGDNGPPFVCAQLKPDQILSWPSAYNLSVPYARSLSNVSA